MRRCRPRQVPPSPSDVAGFRFPPDVILVAVRWYLRYGLSYRDNACLTCPVFLTGPEFLPELREQRRCTLILIDVSKTKGHDHVVEMNQQVLSNLDRMIGEVEKDEQEDAADADCNSRHVIAAARRRAAATRKRAVAALRRMDKAGLPITFDTVAKAAQVSRSWLYSQPDLRAKVERLHAWQTPALAGPAGLRPAASSTLSPTHHRWPDS